MHIVFNTCFYMHLVRGLVIDCNRVIDDQVLGFIAACNVSLNNLIKRKEPSLKKYTQGGIQSLRASFHVSVCHSQIVLGVLRQSLRIKTIILN